jgi:hypothetical protein
MDCDEAEKGSPVGEHNTKHTLAVTVTKHHAELPEQVRLLNHRDGAPHRTPPHRTALHRTAPHRTAPHRTAA